MRDSQRIPAHEKIAGFAHGIRFKDPARAAIVSGTMNRRHFLRTTAASVAFPANIRGAPNSKVSIAVIEVAALCDVDDRILARAVETVSRKAATHPRGERDFRRLLEDKSIDAVVSKTLNSEIEEGHKSALLCHLGKMAWRTGQTIDLTPQGEIAGDHRAKKFWRREYQPGWEPRVA